MMAQARPTGSLDRAGAALQHSPVRTPTLSRRFALAVLAALVMLPTATVAAEPRRFVVFHTSDVHGFLASRLEPVVGGTARRVGGMAALTALVASERLPHVLVDSGDWYQGTPEGNLTRGAAVVTAMNLAGYTTAALGNHEFDYGEPNVRQLVAAASFPVLGANIVSRATGTRLPYLKASTTTTVAGVSVAFVGVITHHTATATLPQHVAHLEFTDEVVAAREATAEARKAGAEVVVVLSHCGLAPSRARQRLSPSALVLTAEDLAYRGDLAIARGADADLVLGGHMHTGLTGPWVDPESGVPIVQSEANLVSVSRLEIAVTDSGPRRVTVTGRLVDLEVAVTGEDPKVKAHVEKTAREVGAALDEVIGRANEAVARIEPGFDSPLGSWVADTMRAAASADVAVQNSYGVRADIPAGNITRRTLYEVYPFENTLIVVEMTGAALRRLVLDNLQADRSAIQLSGAHVRFRPGDREALTITVGARPLDLSARYRVATNSYLANGGTGGAAMAGCPQTPDPRNVRELLEAAVRRDRGLVPPPSGRFERMSP